MLIEELMGLSHNVLSYPRDPVVPSQKVGLGWVPGRSRCLLRRYDWIPRDTNQIRDQPHRSKVPLATRKTVAGSMRQTRGVSRVEVMVSTGVQACRG